MIYLMHGFIGSGKTTKAKQLETKLNAIRFTPDEWMASLFGSDPPAKEFPKILNALLSRFESIWIPAAKSGANVILDYGFWTLESRQKIESKLADENLAYSWINIATPIHECRIRNQARQNSSNNELNITDATFEYFLNQFEPMQSGTKYEQQIQQQQ